MQFDRRQDPRLDCWLRRCVRPNNELEALMLMMICDASAR